MKLGVDGTIENDSVISYDALNAEVVQLRTQLAEAVIIIKDQAALINQIKEEIQSGNLVYRQRTVPTGEPK